MNDNIRRREIAELAAGSRLQHRLFFHALGRLLPAAIEVEQVKTVLDVFCGSGAWAIDLAKSYPSITITALDPNPQMLEIARVEARAADVSNITFVTASPLEPLSYEQQSFDLLHIQRVMPPLMPRDLPAILRHLRAVGRSGGWLYLSDFEIGLTSSPTFESFETRVRETLRQRQCSMTTDGLAFSPAVFYPRQLADIGCKDVHYTLTPVDLGNQPGSFGYNHALSLMVTNLRERQLLIETGQATQQEIDEIFQNIREEIQQPNFCGVGMLISTLGTIP